MKPYSCLLDIVAISIKEGADASLDHILCACNSDEQNVDQ